jgi:hypothetical protein
MCILLGAPAAVIATVILIGVHEKIIKYSAKVMIIIHIAALEMLIRSRPTDCTGAMNYKLPLHNLLP